MDYKLISAGVSLASSVVISGVSLWKQKKLEEAIDKFSDTITVDIEDEYVEKIVQKSIDRNVKDRIAVMSKVAVEEIRADIYKEIKKEVNKSYSDIKASVKQQVEKEVGRIDLDDIRNEIIAEGREKASAEFKKDLDKVIEQYNDNLSQINTIYSNIAETLSNNKKGTTLTIGA